MPSKKKKITRSSVTGRFVKRAMVAVSPATTTTETISTATTIKKTVGKKKSKKSTKRKKS